MKKLNTKPKKVQPELFKTYNHGVFFRPYESTIEPKGWVLSYTKKVKAKYFQPQKIEYIEIGYPTEEIAREEMQKLVDKPEWQQ